jgi:hypothetical protein
MWNWFPECFLRLIQSKEAMLREATVTYFVAIYYKIAGVFFTKHHVTLIHGERTTHRGRWEIRKNFRSNYHFGNLGFDKSLQNVEWNLGFDRSLQNVEWNLGFGRSLQNVEWNLGFNRSLQNVEFRRHLLQNCRCILHQTLSRHSNSWRT